MTFLILWNCPGGGGGGGGVSTVWTEETLAGDTPGRECPHDDVEIRPRMGIMEDRVPSMNIESLYGGGDQSAAWSLVLPETMYTGARRCVCTLITLTGGLSRGKDFARSDWPPGLCGRFGRLR